MDLTRENLTLLLDWLDRDQDAAGQEYVRIRADLARKFTAQSCPTPDKLADATMDRVAEILTPELIQRWEGQKERYFYRVAYYIMLESRAKKVDEVELPVDLVSRVIDTDEESEVELEHHCLDKCIDRLTAVKRDLITKYYVGKRAVKIKNRNELAQKLNLALPVLRVKALRIRKGLKTCMEECLKINAASKPSA